MLDIKLYLRDEIQEIKELSVKLGTTLLFLADVNRNESLPGYTHFQLAMPSTFGLWFSAYAESLCDDLELLYSIGLIIDKNPLGSAAGYGSSFPIDRDITTQELGFNGINVNSVYAQMTRGKTEKTVAFALSGIAGTLSKMSADIVLFMNQEFQYVSFPDELTTGSSIMPHKKNPDVWELIRAKCNRISAVPNEITLLMSNLPSGYHRDMQLTKEILFPTINCMKELLRIAEFTIAQIKVKRGILDDKKYNTLYTVDAVNELVQKGHSFRDAYLAVGKKVLANTFSRPDETTHSHLGSVGNPGIEQIARRLQALST